MKYSQLSHLISLYFYALEIARFLTHFNGITDTHCGTPCICGISESPPANYAKYFDPAFQDIATALAVAELYTSMIGFIHSNADTSDVDICSEQVPVGFLYSA